ncbi:uncharacterized protein RSE6_15128 [Rhynchosporium secalis]|uniref:Uncharacterized protein n=1 Tax=Rhynchosporium secalis TaxID=38038 RepID=A0A1E1MWR5_RHYSE|nr:uncharacterized protein RSE6_15128 [Rhynchosporium secalis]
MVTLSNTIEDVENRLTRLVNEAIKYKFGSNGRHRRIHHVDIVSDAVVGDQTYYIRDEAIYNEDPWRDFVDYKVNGRLTTNETPRKLFQDVDKAIIDGDIIVKLVDTPGQLIDWEDLRGWHYHSPGDKFNDEFDHILPSKGNDADPTLRCCVSIYSTGRDFGGNGEETRSTVKFLQITM